MLREHCEREGRDYDSILKTMIYQFDTSDVPRMLASCGPSPSSASSGAIGLVKDVSTIKPLEIMGKEVIPVAAEF